MHERREQALLELGRLLTEDVPSVRRRLIDMASVLEVTEQTIVAGEADRKNPKVQELVEGDREAISSAGEDWRSLRGRIDWCAYLAGERLRPPHTTFNAAAMRVPTFAADTARLSDDERDVLWADEQEARDAFVKHVREQVPRVDVDQSALADGVTKWLSRSHRGQPASSK
jgi:hypothetical protein